MGDPTPQEEMGLGYLDDAHREIARLRAALAKAEKALRAVQNADMVTDEAQAAADAYFRAVSNR